MDPDGARARPARPGHARQGRRVAVTSIQKRTRNGRVSYSVRYRDPAGHSRRKVFARKVDAARWLAENDPAARNRGPWVDPAAGRDRLGPLAERWFSST